MPRVNFVKKARKDNPAAKAGEPYYWWEFRYGGKRYSKTYPKRSQLTQSKMASAYDAIETLGESLSFEGDYTSKEEVEAWLGDVEAAVEEAGDQLREVAEEYQESIDAILEHFPSGNSNTEEMEEKKDHLEELAEELAFTFQPYTVLDVFDEDVELDPDDLEAEVQAAMETLTEELTALDVEY